MGVVMFPLGAVSSNLGIGLVPRQSPVSLPSFLGIWFSGTGHRAARTLPPRLSGPGPEERWRRRAVGSLVVYSWRRCWRAHRQLRVPFCCRTRPERVDCSCDRPPTPPTMVRPTIDILPEP